MPRETVHTDILGHETTVSYSSRWAGYALVAIRLAIGWVLFDAGVTYVFTPGNSVATELLAVPPSNPFGGIFAFLGQFAGWLVDPLFGWGLAVSGASLIFGAALRTSAGVGIVLSTLQWASALPLDGGFLVDHHLVYAFVLFGLAVFGAGRIVGLDAYFEAHRLVRDRPWLRYLLG
ncbi:MAG: hypothetical protein ABEJ44_07630 [Halanaeroarchaeum sp.]